MSFLLAANGCNKHFMTTNLKPPSSRCFLDPMLIRLPLLLSFRCNKDCYSFETWPVQFHFLFFHLFFFLPEVLWKYGIYICFLFKKSIDKNVSYPFLVILFNFFILYIEDNHNFPLKLFSRLYLSSFISNPDSFKSNFPWNFFPVRSCCRILTPSNTCRNLNRTRRIYLGTARCFERFRHRLAI